MGIWWVALGICAFLPSAHCHEQQSNALDFNDTGIDLALGNKVNDFLGIRATLSSPLDDFEFDANCDFATQIFIRSGIEEAKNIAAAAVAKLSTENPFKNSQPYDEPWKAMRFTVFGSEATTSQNTLIDMFTKIGDTIGGITFHCGEPALAVAATRNNPFDCVMCRVLKPDGTFGVLDAFQFLSANEQDPNSRTWDTQHCGYAERRNVVLCTDTLPGGKSNFKLLRETTPTAGESIGELKRTYAATMVHELSHVYGTTDHLYDFDGVTTLREDAENGKNRAFPGQNADGYALLGVALATQDSTPSMDSLDWSTGQAVNLALV